jgi:hypothetical protein
VHERHCSDRPAGPTYLPGPARQPLR